MLRPSRHPGFTLIELMVSVALMLILVGAVIMIFKDSSEVFSMSDAKMSVYQNGRVALDLMARELTSADNNRVGTTEFPLVIRNPIAGNNQEILRFRTTTSWVDTNGTRQSGTATVRYFLQTDNGMWTLMREINDAGTLSTDIVAQYIPYNVNAVRMAAFEYDVPSRTWTYIQPAAGSSETYNYNTIPRLPDAIRITLEFTDHQQRVVRTMTRTVWLPKSLNS